MSLVLFHQVIGSLQDIKEVTEQHAVNLTGDLRLCASCEMGKSTNQPVSKVAEKRASACLELVYTDFAEPVSESSGGSRFATVVVDDLTRLRRV